MRCTNAFNPERTNCHSSPITQMMTTSWRRLPTMTSPSVHKVLSPVIISELLLYQFSWPHHASLFRTSRSPWAADSIVQEKRSIWQLLNEHLCGWLEGTGICSATCSEGRQLTAVGDVIPARELARRLVMSAGPFVGERLRPRLRTRHHFQLHQQRQVVGGHVWMRAAEDFVVLEPVGVERTQQTQGPHGVARVEDVVYDALEVKPANHRL